MAAALIGGGEERRKAITRHFRSDQPGAKGEDICVFVLARQSGAGGGLADGSTDMAMAVGRNGYSDAGSADQHSPLRPAVAKGGGQRVGKIGIIHGSAVVGPQIESGKAEAGQFFDQKLLQIEAGMVAGDSDGLGHGGGRWSLGLFPRRTTICRRIATTRHKPWKLQYFSRSG